MVVSTAAVAVEGVGGSGAEFCAAHKCEMEVKVIFKIKSRKED